jgi:nicotinamide N-methyltransferase
LVELETMKRNMDEMENERAQMVAEVEAQIERALASMAFSDGEGFSDYSRPPSAMSEVSGGNVSRMGHSGIGVGHASVQYGQGGLRHVQSGPGLRHTSGNSAGSESMSESMDGASSRRLRSMATTTTLADDASDEVTRVGCELSTITKGEGKMGTLLDDESALVVPIGTRRFSVSKHEGADGFVAVDQGITERSDVVAIKVHQIQQKVSSPLES